MPNVIRIKRRLSNSGLGTALPTGLRNAELAFNEVNNTLYIGTGGTNTEVNAEGVAATPIIGEGAVWQGTATFGNVKTTGYVAVGDEAYAYTNTFPPSVDSAQGGKLLASTEYVDSALARGTGSGMSLFPVAADVATTVPIVAGNYYDNLQGLGTVRVAIPQPASAAAGLALYELKGTPTVQGVNLVANDRVLIMGHLDPTNIGIWTIPNGAGASTPWVREAGLNVAQAYTYGARVFVTAGDNANKTFAVASDPLNPTKDVGGPNFNTLSFIQHSSGATTVPAGANIKFKRVVRAKSDYYQIIAGKVVVDGVVLNQNDRFIWTPKNENPGGHNPVGYTVGDGLGDESGDYDSSRAGIYRVNYDRTLDTNLTTGLPDFYSVVVRAGDFNDDIEAVAAHNTKVLVREGATNANKIFTITTNASSFIIADTFPGEVALFGYDSNWSGAGGALSGIPMIDGVQTDFEDLTANPPRLGSVVLVKNEVDKTTNGLYYIKTNGTWIRHPAANETGELTYGSYIRVKYGTINKNSGFVQVANFDPLVIGTHPIVFESPQALLDFRAGVGLGRDGRSFYVKTAGTTRINVTEAGVDLAVIPADVTTGQSVETDPALIGTAYLAVHADKYGRVLASSRDSLTATELRDKIVGTAGTGLDDTTGTQNLVFSESPDLTGVPTAPTADANTSTTQIATTAFVMSNGGTSILGTNNAFTGANTFTNAAGQTFRTAETADAIIVKGGGNTNGRSITLITDTLSGSRTVTFPDHTDNYTLVGVATTQTLTNKTLTAPKMSSTYIADTNNNELIKFPAAVTSATNEITVTNAINGSAPEISATGSADANIDLKLTPKGTGAIFVNGSIKLATGSVTSIADVNGNEIVRFPTTVASAVNEITVTNAITGARPTISATGGDTNIDLALSGKGTGTVFVNGSIKLATTNATSIADVNGNEIIKFPTTVASAVNEITVTNAITGAAPDISATGGDTNIDLKLTAKGTGAVNSTSNFTVSSGKALNLSNATVTAGTNAQGQGALTNDINIVTSAATAPSGVTLPAATAGRVVVVVNRSSQANTVNVYPASGGTINALAANALFAVAANSTAIFRASSTTQWYSELVDLVNGTTGTLAVGSGGTGQTTFAVNGIIYGNTANGLQVTAAGTDNQVLGANASGVPTWSSSTGTGNVVRASSPTLATPTIGVATATSVNKVAITAPATSATLTIADGKILTASNTLTFTGTDSSSVAFGAGGTVLYTTATLNALAATTSAQLAGVLSDETGFTTGAKAVFSTSPSFETSVVGPSGSFDVFNTASTTINAFGAATTATIGYSGAAASTTNISTGANGGGVTKTINIGTNGAAGSTTNINIGSAATTGVTIGATSNTGTHTINGNVNFVGSGMTYAINSGTFRVDSGAFAAFNNAAVTTNTATFAVFNANATTINAFGAATAINMGASTGTTTINNNLTVSGNLTINGTTTTINASTLTVDDKNIELGSVAAVVGLTGTIANYAGNTATITGMSSTVGLIPGMALTRTAGATFGTAPVIANIDSATQITVTSTSNGTTGAITFNAAGISDDTANEGGITLRSTSDKTWRWLKATAAWTSSENIALIGGKTVILNGATSGAVTLSVPAAAGTTAIAFPATAGTVITTGDTGTVSATMLAADAVSTVKIADNAVSFAKLPNSAAAGLSVVGRSANSAGNFAEINAGTDGQVLRRSGTALGFGTIATAGITDAAVTSAKLRNSDALSVIGRSANDAGVPADIAAATDGHVLRRSGTALGFGTIATAGIADNAVSFAKLPNSAAAGISVVGRSANSAGNFAEIASGTDGHVLRQSGTTLGFGTIATAGIADNAVSFAKLPNSAAAGLSVVGRSTNSAGNFAEINAGTDGQVLRRSGTAIGFGTIATAGLADSAVTNAKVLDGTLTAAKFATGELCTAVGSCTIDGGTF